MKQITLLPADLYKIVNNSIINDYEKNVIIDLYQPIIGPVAVSLYLTFLSDLKRQDKLNVVYTHHHLLTSLKSSLVIIKQATKSLESVGLIKTFVKVNDNINNYIYELYSPMEPNEFLNHPVLNVILYNNIGEKEYNELVEYYKKHRLDTKEYSEISKSINDTYVSISSFNRSNENIEERKVLGLNIKETIDFDMIISSIPCKIISDKAFNKRIRELVNNLAFVYDIDTLKMVDIIRLSIDENGMINKETLINSVRKYYDFNSNGNLPTLIYRTQPEYLKNPVGDNSNRGKMLYVFENTTPYDFLRKKNKGIKPTSRDLKILEYLAVELKMKPAVINVLIDYVLRINDNKLNKNYIEAIAGGWIRSNINTADDAMNRAEKEHKKVKKTSLNNDSKKVPSWFNENHYKEELTIDEKKELESMMEEFR